jgi:uncharacterized protein (TIGR02118 family)
MTYPTSHGVVGFFGDQDQAAAAARSLAAATGPDAPTSVTVHTAVPGHSGDWMAVVRAVGDRGRLVAALGDVADQGLFAAEFRRVKAHPVTWAVGEQTPGIGMLFAAHRRPDLTHEQYDTHWRDRHAPLALKHHVGMWDYVQCSFEGPLTTTSPDYDGLAICKFATLEDYKERFFDSDEGRAVIGADVRRFSDVGASPTMRMTETVLR